MDKSAFGKMPFYKNKKGLFSFEAGISFIVLILLIAGAAPENAGNNAGAGNAGIFASQKISDILTVWAIEGPQDSEMISDANFFLGTAHEIEIEGKKIFSSIESTHGKIVSMEMLIVACL